MIDPIDAGGDGPATQPNGAPVEDHPRRHAWMRRLLLLALLLFAAWVIVRTIGKIDWAAVWDALGHLTWWQLLVLIVVLFVRQILNALPLAIFIDDLGVRRAVVNDLAAHLLNVIAPPPADIVMRVRMFTSWGIEASKAVAGSMMNMLTFYIMRFSMPVLGFVLILPVRFDVGFGVTALLGAAVAGTLGGLVVVGLRSEQLAERIGRLAGTGASKVKKRVDPETWAAALVQFRLHMKDTFAAGFPRSAIGLVGLVFADATVLLLALRFVGLSSAEVPAVELYAAFLCAYPLTLFPMMGLGIFDAVLLEAMVDIGEPDVEAAVVAALIVWRAITLGGPVLLGAASLALWRRSPAGARTPEPNPAKGPCSCPTPRCLDTTAVLLAETPLTDESSLPGTAPRG